jgi:hypothetical protein
MPLARLTDIHLTFVDALRVDEFLELRSDRSLPREDRGFQDPKRVQP